MQENRPSLDIQKVATGEHWYATDAKIHGLVDDIRTSDEYLEQRAQTADVFSIKYQGRRKLMERLTESAAAALRIAITRMVSDAENRRFGL